MICSEKGNNEERGSSSEKDWQVGQKGGRKTNTKNVGESHIEYYFVNFLAIFI